MELNVKWYFLFCFIPEFVKNENVNFENGAQNHKTAIYANFLLDTIKAQRWEENEKHCLDAMTSILDSAKNFTLWAVWILDTIQPPVGQLYGQKYYVVNYDQCLKPNYGFRVDPNTPKTQYCVAEVNLTGTEEISKPIDYIWVDHNVTADVYLRKPTKHGRIMSRMIWGICVPEVCQSSATAKVMKSLLQISHLGALSDTASINVTHCENRKVMDASIGPTIFKQVVLLLATVAVFSTYLVTSGRAVPGTFAGEFASSFNISRNMETLTKVRDDEVYSMNIMRVITSFLIVFLHYVLCVYSHFIVNGLDHEKFLDEAGEISSHFEIIVDTFLTLSGLLYVRGIFSNKSQNPLKFIWKRYIRLIPVMVALMLYIITGHNANGPIWHRIVGVEVDICKENWLMNLLMISNFYVDKMCLLVSWYVPCDYQLCVFITILYIIYKKNNTLGKCAFAVFFIAAIVIPGIVTYVNDLAPLMFHGVDSMTNCRQSPEFVHFYVKSYCRAGPFLVGAMMGYIMYAYKPKNHRNIIGTVTSYLGLLFSLVLMYQVLTIGHYFYYEGEPLSSAVYVAFNRTLWGLAICIIIGVSEYGNLTFLNTAFSWYPLVPLSRLTYGVYFTHFPMLELIFGTMRTTFEYDMFSMGVGTAGTTVFALLASLIIWLLFEAPIININNMLLDKTWKNKGKEYIQENNSSAHGNKKLT